jgi:thioredoxin reductase (NADPH)
VTRLDRNEEGFSAEWGGGAAGARTILLATGVKNRRPLIDEALHDEAVARGLIRYCPICDGFEVTDRKVGVIGSGASGLAEAVFLRGYSADISLIAPDTPHEFDGADRAQIDRLGIVLLDGPCQPIEIDDNSILVTTADGEHRFDSIYPALGSDTRVELARQVGAKLAGDTSCITVDAHQRTSIPGLYAAGDVVIGLDQISHAMGEGGVAATTIRNDLAKKRPLLR